MRNPAQGGRVETVDEVASRLELVTAEEVRGDFDAVARLLYRRPAPAQDVQPALQSRRVRLTAQKFEVVLADEERGARHGVRPVGRLVVLNRDDGGTLC